MKTIKKFNVPNYPTRNEVQEYLGLTCIGFVAVVVILYSLIG